VVDIVAVGAGVYEARGYLLQKYAGPYNCNIRAVFDVVELGNKLATAFAG
jgi:hypothetical protein